MAMAKKLKRIITNLFRKKCYYEVTIKGEYFKQYLEKITEGTFKDTDYIEMYENHINLMGQSIEKAFGNDAFLLEGETDIPSNQKRYRVACLVLDVLNHSTQMSV